MLFDKHVFRHLYRMYVKVLTHIVKESGFETTDFYISDTALRSVFMDVKKDIDILKQRRPLNHGVSMGKITGTIVFRLCRTPVVFCHQRLINNPQALKISVDTALAFGLELINAPVNLWPKYIIKELKYFLAKRHINQESLGICFDVMCHQPVVSD